MSEVLHANVGRLKDQWQVALIWMRDVNLAAVEKTRRGMVTRRASHEIAEYQLHRYFEMVEAQLTASSNPPALALPALRSGRWARRLKNCSRAVLYAARSFASIVLRCELVHTTNQS